MQLRFTFQPNFSWKL